MSITIDNSEVHSRQSKNKKRNVIIVVIVLISFIVYLGYENGLFAILTPADTKPIFLFQDLIGDKTNTWLSWDLAPGQVLSIAIINGANLPQEKVSAVKDAILSTQTVEISDWTLHKGLPGDSSLYYKGWQGALADASSQKTKFYIPQQLAVVDSGDALVTINLTNDKNPDGMSGFTKSVIEGNHIVQTRITIYGASHLSEEQINTITRHEFGHALGLAHSTAPEDLMAPSITTQYPYISGCDIDALVGLYDGNQKSEVICTK